MARVWVFQANPERYDIDGALAALTTIDWWTPQYASEIRPGDTVVLWRSGDQAGVVGVATVEHGPRQAPPTPAEERFVRGEIPREEQATVVTLQVAATDLVPKSTVASLNGWGSHQIVTAPMGTVFPVTGDQWAELAPLLGSPPVVEVSEDPGWPQAFSWQQRTKSVTPLPGGIDAYQEVLARILDRVGHGDPARDELVGWLRDELGVSERRAAYVVNFLSRIGLLRREASRVALTPEGRWWLFERDGLFLLALIHGRVRYIGEMLAHLDQPRTTEELLDHANARYGMNWTSRGQIVRRRHLLGGVGAVEFDEEQRLRRTEFGDRALSELELAAALDGTGYSEHREEGSQEPPPPDEHDQQPDTAERLVSRLLATAHDSDQPNAFEQATRDAFAFLGFDADWLGGSGSTDVLLRAPLGADEHYRVAVDTKSTARQAVSDAQINWVTIDEHQERHDADYVAVVAPAFQGDRLGERARRDRSVALLTVTALADVIRQHEIAPLGLDAYRDLFDPNIGPDGVLEHGDALRRQLVLAAEVVRLVDQLASDEGAITSEALYWNLDRFAEQFEGQRAARDEIRAVCHALANPPLSLLRSEQDRFAPLGSRTTAADRLRLFADLIESGIPETADEIA